MIPHRSFSLLTIPAALLVAAGIAGHAEAAAPGAAPAASGPGAAAAFAGQPAPGSSRRIAIPSPQGKPYPYSIEIPAGWEVQSSKSVPGVFLGPPAVGGPENDTRMVFIRVSPASVLDPEALAAGIKANAAAATDWSAPLVEVRAVGGVQGVLVRMDSGSGAQARSTLVLKMPLGKNSLDFMMSAARTDFERQLPQYQRIILSALPAK